VRQRFLLLMLLGGLVLVTAMGCRERSGSVRLVVGADARGQLGPAVDEPVGGMSRRAAALRVLRQDGGAPLVVLEAGGWMSPGGDEADRRRDRLHAELLGQLHTDLVVLGPGELRHPTESLLLTLRDAGPRWLAGSWRGARRDFGADTAWVVERGGVLLGVLDHAEAGGSGGVDPSRLEGGLLRRARALRPWVDLLVVVAALPSAREDSLARELDGLADLLLVTGRAGIPTERRVGGVLLASPGAGGRRLGVWEAVVGKGRLVRSRWSLVPLRGEDRADPGVDERIAALEEREQALVRGRREALRQQILARLGMSGAAMAGEDAVARYEGAEACATCHAQAWTAWRDSPHAAAWQNLEAQDATADPPRVRRATTGWLEKGGWVNHRETPHLSAVGCEACHGRGSSHVFTRGSSFKEMATDPGAACIRCHEQVPDVDPHSLRPR
jgi:hypothetical protein